MRSLDLTHTHSLFLALHCRWSCATAPTSTAPTATATRRSISPSPMAPLPPSYSFSSRAALTSTTSAPPGAADRGDSGQCRGREMPPAHGADPGLVDLEAAAEEAAQLLRESLIESETSPASSQSPLTHGGARGVAAECFTHLPAVAAQCPLKHAVAKARQARVNGPLIRRAARDRQAAGPAHRVAAWRLPLGTARAVASPTPLEQFAALRMLSRRFDELPRHRIRPPPPRHRPVAEAARRDEPGRRRAFRRGECSCGAPAASGSHHSSSRGRARRLPSSRPTSSPSLRRRSSCWPTFP